MPRDLKCLLWWRADMFGRQVRSNSQGYVIPQASSPKIPWIQPEIGVAKHLCEVWSAVEILWSLQSGISLVEMGDVVGGRGECEVEMHSGAVKSEDQ